MDETNKVLLERVFNILDPEVISDERMYAFHAAAELYRMWEKEGDKE